MQLENIKKYKTFVAIVILFIISTAYSIFIYFNWNNDLPRDSELKTSVEVNLPIIDWNRYSNLSKNYENANLERD